MSLAKASSPEIDPKDPWTDDPLARKNEGEILANLISTLGDAPFVVSLKGGWGTGKSVFLRRLGHHLQESLKIPVVHVDAWQSDYVDDPLLALASALGDRLKQIEDGKVKRDIGSIVTGLAGSAGKITLPVLSILASTLIPGGGKAVEVAAAMPQLAQNFLDWDHERKSAETEFKDSLIKAKAKLHKASGSPSKSPIVIVVDELDRCRPDFAIKFLERMKHFFSVDGVCFLIATDYENLPNAVNTVYGPGVKGELYLRKFFDFEFNLPSPSANDHALYLFRDFPSGLPPAAAKDMRKELLSRIYSGRYVELLENDRGALEQAEYSLLFGGIAETMKLQLRDMLQAHTLLMAFVRSYPKNAMRYPFVDCFVACMRFKDPQHFRALVTRSGATKLAANLIAGKESGSPLLGAIPRFLAIGRTTSLMSFENELSRHVQDASKNGIEALAYHSLQHRATYKLDRRHQVLSVDVEKYLHEVVGLTAAFSELEADETDPQG